jgi:hypothetical protein
MPQDGASADDGANPARDAAQQALLGSGVGGAADAPGVADDTPLKAPDTIWRTTAMPAESSRSGMVGGQNW